MSRKTRQLLAFTRKWSLWYRTLSKLRVCFGRFGWDLHLWFFTPLPRLYLFLCCAIVPFPSFDSRIRFGLHSRWNPVNAGRPAACSSCWRRRIHFRGSSASRRHPEWSLWWCTSPSCCAGGRSPSRCGGTTRGGAGGSHSLVGSEEGLGCRIAWRRRLLQFVFLPWLMRRLEW